MHDPADWKSSCGPAWWSKSAVNIQGRQSDRREENTTKSCSESGVVSRVKKPSDTRMGLSNNSLPDSLKVLKKALQSEQKRPQRRRGPPGLEHRWGQRWGRAAASLLGQPWPLASWQDSQGTNDSITGMAKRGEVTFDLWPSLYYYNDLNNTVLKTQKM